MTVKEAAQRLELSEASVYVLVQTGRLRCYRHAVHAASRPRIVIAEHHLAEYLASVETPITGPAAPVPTLAPRRRKGQEPDWMAVMMSEIRRRP